MGTVQYRIFDREHLGIRPSDMDVVRGNRIVSPATYPHTVSGKADSLKWLMFFKGIIWPWISKSSKDGRSKRSLTIPEQPAVWSNIH